MSLLSTRLGLKKPQDSDPFLTTDFDGNLDIIDSYPGVWVCTSSTKPLWGAAQAGQQIFCTDTRTLLSWTGSAWVDSLAVSGAWQLFQPLGATVTPATGLGDSTFNYTLGTISSSRACNVMMWAALDFSPPLIWGQESIYFQLGASTGSITTIGGKWTQQAVNVTGYSGSATSLKQSSVVGMGFGNIAAGNTTLTMAVVISNENLQVGAGVPFSVALDFVGVSVMACTSNT